MVKNNLLMKGIGWCIFVLLMGISVFPSTGSILVENQSLIGNSSSSVFSTTSPTIVYVDDDYNETTPDWGYDHFDDIQSGINAVAENGTVHVYNGVYSFVLIDKTIDLIGESKDGTIIDAGAGHMYSVVAITADSVKITGFTIRQYWHGWWYEQVIGVFSDYNTISGNIIESGRDYGIYLNRYVSNNRISGNIIRYNPCAIYLEEFSGDYNTIVGNTISNNSGGISYYFGPGATFIYHNNFINNGIHAVDMGLLLWHNGYPSGGNYWDDYTGSDNFSGPDQNISGSDGIGDTPYDIPGGAQDRYPLMEPWTPGCGGCNGDDVIDIGDIVFLINYLYRNGPAPEPICVGDVNCNDVVDIGDVVYLNNYLYRGMSPPCSNCCG